MSIVSSSADGFSGSLNADGFGMTIAPFDPVSGVAPPAYDSTRSAAFFDRQYDLSPVESNTLSLEMEATHFSDVARSPGNGVDEIGANGAADFFTAHFLLLDRPLTPSPPVSLGLSIDATGIHSDSSSSFVFGPNRGFIAGDASFQSLAITGQLVGGKTLTFSGDAAPNTVIYSSPTVTITLDEQQLLLPPAASGGTIGPSIMTDAIDIHFNNAKFAGHTISGHFDIGQSSASYALIRPFA